MKVREPSTLGSRVGVRVGSLTHCRTNYLSSWTPGIAGVGGGVGGGVFVVDAAGSRKQAGLGVSASKLPWFGGVWSCLHCS